MGKQAGAYLASCGGGRCDQSGAQKPSCDGGKCVQDAALNATCTGAHCSQLGCLHCECKRWGSGKKSGGCKIDKNETKSEDKEAERKDKKSETKGDHEQVEAQAKPETKGAPASLFSDDDGVAAMIRTGTVASIGCFLAFVGSVVVAVRRRTSNSLASPLLAEGESIA